MFQLFIKFGYYSLLFRASRRGNISNIMNCHIRGGPTYIVLYANLLSPGSGSNGILQCLPCIISLSFQAPFPWCESLFYVYDFIMRD